MIHPTLVWHSGPCRTRKVFPHEWTRSQRSATELFHPVVQDLSPERQTHDGFLCHNRALEGKQMYIHKCLIAFLLTSEEMLDYFWSYVHEVLWVSCVSFYSGVAAENQDTLLSLGGLSKKVHWTPLRACWFLILCSTFFFGLFCIETKSKTTLPRYYSQGGKCVSLLAKFHSGLFFQRLKCHNTSNCTNDSLTLSNNEEVKRSI